MPRNRLQGGEGAGSADSPAVVPDRLGRRPRQLSGPVTARGAGNAVITSDLRGGGRPAAYPGADNGARAQAQSFGGKVMSTPDQRGEPRAAYGGGWADGTLTYRERFVQIMRGTSRTGAQESHSGVPNPQADGPPLAEYLMDNRTLSWQIGQSNTTNEDNPGPFAVTELSDGRAFPFGTQDGVPWTSKKWGGTPGLYHQYGQRGTAEGPTPTTFALSGDGSGARIGTLLVPGDPGDGPHEFRGGPPHGRHSHSDQSRKWTMARQSEIPQQRPGRNDRPLNSKNAGQSYNQTVVPEGQTGSGAPPAFVNPGRQAGTVQSRFLRR